MDADAATSLAVILGLLVAVGCGLDVILRPVPVLAPGQLRRRRHIFWTGLVLLYLAGLAAI